MITDLYFQPPLTDITGFPQECPRFFCIKVQQGLSRFVDQLYYFPIICTSQWLRRTLQDVKSFTSKRSIAKSEGLDNSIFHFRRSRDLFMERQVAKKVVKIVKLFKDVIQFF